MDGQELHEITLGNNGESTSNVNLDSGKNAYDNFEKEIETESKQFGAALDPETSYMAGGETEEDFKLRKYFENSQRMAMENGGKPKKMGVVFKNLTVVGKGADTSVIADMSTPFWAIVDFFKPSTWKKKAESTFDILHDVTGFCKDGQMLLVLGRPGAGCSTLLRIISNQRDSYVSVNGDVTYGGISSKEWRKYKAEAIYTPEEDSNHPTLTLSETLDFALKCKTPGNRLPDESKRSFREKVLNLLLSMFGIVHQADTIVGNEFIRGLSGGERKRLTIAEAMVSSASITCWDCSTRGLDAASAFDYAKSIRIMSDTLHKTTIASFYQASDSIYNTFDKVLILEKGRCIYFGPVGKAKDYFMSLGFDCEARKSTPDFLTGVTNPQERIIKKGFEDRVPETSADFETAWRASELYRDGIKELEEYESQIEAEQPRVAFVEEVRNEKSRTNPKSSQYTTSFVTQVVALIKRNFSMIWGDKFGICSRYLSVLIQAFVYGSIFFQLNRDIDGLFTRGGAILSSIIFNAFLSIGEMSMTFFGRRVLQKHRSYAMYRPSALHIAQVVTDIPFTFLQVLLYSIIVYFMVGLGYDAGKFFVFIFTLLGCSLACTALFRLFGNLCPSMYIAQNILNVFVIFMLTYAGYTIPKQKMHPWFGWFFWINIFGYTFKALMDNEMTGTDFNCDASAIPFDPLYAAGLKPNNSYADEQYRICPMGGAVQGDTKFKGEFYLEHGLSFPHNQLALNVIVVYLFWLLFVVCNMIAMEVLDHTSGGYTHKVYKKGKAPKLNDVEEEKQLNAIVANATNNMKDTLKMYGGIFTWQNIRYTVPVMGGQRLLLDNIEGWIKPGQMTALMGSSGAGKTTLLDVLAKRKTIGVVEGDCTLNGKPLEIDFERITGYVEQMDVHNPGLTVREALRFSAKLRQEPEVSLDEKFKYVEHVLEMMEMKHLGDALIGTLETGVGISVEERKRLTIGVELVAKPHILFLDEPTSGLDAQSSYNIIKFIRKLADAGMPLVCTIHQPSSVLFEHFDRLLLLAKGGKTVYFGDIGEKSSILSSYFQRHGCRPCNDSENPAEYMLECIGAGVHGKTDVDWPAAWRDSPERNAVNNELSTLRTQVDQSLDNKGEPREFATTTWFQVKEVYKRLNLIWWRDPFYTYGSFIQSALCGLIIGFTFWSLKDSSSDMNQRIFFVFEALMLGILLIFVVMPQLIMQREYFKRDFASKFYSWFPFAISIVVVELPYILVSSTIFYFCSYWTAGLEHNNSDNFFFWLIFVFFNFFCVSFGQAVAAVCVNMFFAMTIIPLLIVFLFLFCGVMVPPEKIPYFWRSWIYKINPARYFMEGIITDVLHWVNVECTEEDLAIFTAPPGLTCEEYTKDFMVEGVPGKIRSDLAPLPTGETRCGYCIYANGKEYYSTLGWDEGNRWRNFGILCCYIVFNIFLVILFVYLTRKGTALANILKLFWLCAFSWCWWFYIYIFESIQ
ncbi:hypothetical protein DICPUDRAFT_149091 [Dictyostelium purpureum]|uniref:ABC transporter domain-containing protein n=1 Tax=Dictyostelium purpureum TaxID=5786 RepID=F0ZCU0_DICPU|nr:uncharacterized protein DICPUDRAFT_149091 [Dictyostelium purpureum]EGC38277.1 hypothetical protein DICPUDRAFT_149091 [Dictyostelium purpureum]|eukprot:XP_003285234.1 hypothetical protein DICPUDRAFT_149091 [Dictyostelium purpureum]